MSFACRHVSESIRNAARAATARAADSWAPIKSKFTRLIAPTSLDEDARRHELVLNSILSISFMFFAALESIIIRNEIAHGIRYSGVSSIAGAGLLAFCALLFLASKRGYGKAASYALICFYAIGACYEGWTWGASLPATLLAVALVIVTSSILIGARFGIIATVVMLIALAIMGVHEAAVLNVPDWRLEEVTVTDIIAYSATFIFIGFIAWLSNREIERSLDRARASERQLAAERNSLEERVSERTSALLAAEHERTEGLERAARFGELSKGIFHDLMNPLAALSLELEAAPVTSARQTEIRESVRAIAATSKQLGSFMDSIRRSLGDPQINSSERTADLAREIGIVRDILAYQARKEGVMIEIGFIEPITIDVHPVRLHQLILNLVSNALDACVADASSEKKGSGGSAKTIRISAHRERGSIMLRISDNGCGLSAAELSAAFRSGFTTKERGSGRGLMIAKQIVENELKGTVSIESEQGHGTTVTIAIPQDTAHDAAHPGDNLGTIHDPRAGRDGI